MDWSKLVDALKLSPRYLFAIAIGSGALLFGPKAFRDVLGLDAWVTAYRVWVGLAFLGSTAILLGHILSVPWGWLASWNKERQMLAEGRERLNDLTPEEKALLRNFILRNTRTMRLDVQSGVVKGLEHALVIYRSSILGSMHSGFDYNMQPWAWTYLRAHPELLAEDPESDTPTLGDESHRGNRYRRRL